MPLYSYSNVPTPQRRVIVVNNTPVQAPQQQQQAQQQVAGGDKSMSNSPFAEGLQGMFGSGDYMGLANLGGGASDAAGSAGGFGGMAGGYGTGGYEKLLMKGDGIFGTGFMDTSKGDPITGKGAIGQGGSGFLQGAQAGSRIYPGWGTLIGGIAGGIYGNIKGYTDTEKFVDGGLIGNIFGNF